MALLILIYTVCTLLTMVLFVLLGFYGISILKTEKPERYMHVLVGISIFICCTGMVFIGW
jgi:hypothetical protein